MVELGAILPEQRGGREGDQTVRQFEGREADRRRLLLRLSVVVVVVGEGERE